MKRCLLSIMILGIFVPALSAQSTVFIVRHAEKAKSGGDDPELSEAGHTRAKGLARMLKDSGIKAIYATEFRRTQETAAPLAETLALKVSIMPAKDIQGLASRLRARNENALVVGHGNTIPDLIKALGITTPIDIPESDYDNIFVVMLDGKARLIRLHYR